MNKRNGIMVITAVMLLFIAGWQWLIVERSIPVAAAEGRHNIQLQQPVPEAVLKGLDGHEYKIGGVRDKPALINFWASWCGPCHEEVPALKQVYEAYKGKFDLYAVNVTQGDRMKDVKDFVKGYELPFPVLLDTSGGVANDYRILFVPTSFLIDKQGRLTEIIHVLPAEELEKKIKGLIEAS